MSDQKGKGLCLTRKTGEAIQIETAHGPMTIVIGSIRGNQVRLQCKGDRRIKVLRAELVKED